MPEVTMELPDVFWKELTIGDEMIIQGSHVRIDKIELVIRGKILDNTRPTKKNIRVTIPMTDCENPFPYKK